MLKFTFNVVAVVCIAVVALATVQVVVDRKAAQAE